jgi:polysaccharide biosynthesis/export protein
MIPTGYGTWRYLIAASAIMLVSGCGGMSAQGPTTRDITNAAGPETGYSVVSIAPQVLTALDTVKGPSLIETFGNTEPAQNRVLGSGDVVSVTLWDAGGGLFSQNTGGTTTGTQTTVIPNQAVDPRGNITVPFAGQLHVAGLSTVAAQEAIKRALAKQTLQLQALVSVVGSDGNLITIVGDVKTPGRQPSGQTGTRVLDAIASAGGTTSPAYDTVVQLTRGNKMKRVRLSWILAHPAENIYLTSNDVLYAIHDPKIVSVLGALKNNIRLQFDTEKMSLAEVLGQSGGLVDQQSEPAGVFVFRFEPPSVVAALSGRPATDQDTGPAQPVVFRADLRHAQDFFLAQSFQMQDKDIVYVANTESVQIDKILKILLHAAGVAGPFVNRNSAFSVDSNN